MTPILIRIAGIVAVWVILLSAIRFAAAGAQAMLPVARAFWHYRRARGQDRIARGLRLQQEMDRLHDEFQIAFITPWSISLLYGGMILIGAGLAFGSAGDVAQLVSRHPTLLNPFDRLADAAGALMMCTGMSMMLAALSRRRRLSTAISVGFALTGLGVGLVVTV